MNSYAKFATAFVLIALLGGLAGWYVFLRARTTTVQETDAARGFSTDTSAPSSSLGGFFSSVVDRVTGGGSETPDTANSQGQASQPFAQSGTSTGQTSIVSTATSSAQGGSFATNASLSHPSKVPVAGFGFVSQGGALRLYYVERATGYVFAADLAKGTVTRLTNTLRPKVYEAMFDGKGVVERTIAEDGSVETFAGTFGVASTTSTSVPLTGSFLSKNITAITLIPAATPALLYVREGAGGTEGILAARDGTKPQTVFVSPITGWRILSLTDGRMIVAQKAASGVVGVAYEIPKAGALTSNALVPLATPTPGLVVVPRAWSSALLWSSSSNRTTLFVRESDTKQAVTLPIATTAEKCAWVPAPSDASAKKPGVLVAYCAVPKTAPGSDFLENWYQGALHTDDAWWKVDAMSGTAEQFYATTQGIDVHDPVIDPSGTFLAFRDGRDDSLWVLTLTK